MTIFQRLVSALPTGIIFGIMWAFIPLATVGHVAIDEGFEAFIVAWGATFCTLGRTTEDER